MKNKQLTQVVLKVMAASFGIIGFVLYTAPFASTSQASVSGFQIAFDFGHKYVKSIFLPLVNFFIVVLIVIYLLLSMISQIMIFSGNERVRKNVESLYKDLPIEKCKQKALISSLLTSGAGLIVLILDLCVLLNTGLSSNYYIHLGAGAVWSGLLVFFGTILESVAEYLPYVSSQGNVVNKDNQPMVSSQSTVEKSIEEKLVELNSLKEKGLITEEEYQKKRKQILGL